VAKEQALMRLPPLPPAASGKFGKGGSGYLAIRRRATPM